MAGSAANRPLELPTIRLLGYMDCRPDEHQASQDAGLAAEAF